MLAGYGHLLRAADRLRWDESELDLSGDADAWPKLAKYVRVPLSRLLAGFCVAERAVAEQLEPFEAGAETAELRACFAAQADDERRHARFFDRVAAEVLGVDPDGEVRELAGAGVVELFERTLPAKAPRPGRGPLRPVAGGHALPPGAGGRGVQRGPDGGAGAAGRGRHPARDPQGVTNVQADERWHVGLGVRCLQDTGVRERRAGGDAGLGGPRHQRVADRPDRARPRGPRGRAAPPPAGAGRQGRVGVGQRAVMPDSSPPAPIALRGRLQVVRAADRRRTPPPFRRLR